MSNKGAAFLLKAKRDDGYATVAGLRVNQMAIHGDIVAVTHKEPGVWRELLSGAGTRSVSIGAAGIFLGSEAQAEVQASALAGTVAEYELSFEDGNRLGGRFLIQRLDYIGDFNGERNYSIQLESSGEVSPR